MPAPTVTLTLPGADELAARLRGLPIKIAKKCIRPALRDGSKVIAAEVRARAPKVSGRTVAAVKVRASPRSRKLIGVNVTVGAGWFAGPTFYAAFVAFGHKVGRTKGGKPYRRLINGRWVTLKPGKVIPKNPYLDQAAAAGKGAAAQAVADRMKSNLDAVAAEKAGSS